MKQPPCTNNRRCKSQDFHVTSCPVFKAAVADWREHPEKYESGPVGGL